ncbi:hypothetical protein QUF63_00260 [Anaerolineales bacterium HSG25]|nr:hypothetical protein [Anaerolineales bacterium HSG25]
MIREIVRDRSYSLSYQTVQQHDHNRWVMELEDFGGDSINQLNLAGQLDIAQFLQVAIQVTEVLGQLHQKHIIHKDIVNIQ